ncbi:hypothetical protein MWH25_12615 [Natroniella acetigena]|uniref:LPP20 family lipoprotein n=1 Tax=Natroniella acetigena TaxID=52004 RepID=UPI00200A1C04|nr:hypothetical protein [Natroniella acetigena]MCK8828566.1 hypothetical protein [Natroniella acetigena]
MNLRKSTYIPVLIISFLLLINLNVAAFSVQEETARIDWERGIIAVQGEGVAAEHHIGGQAKLMAQRAARVDAYRNAAEFIDGVRVNSQTTMEDMVATSDRVDTQVRGFIEGALIVDSDYDPDLKISTVTMELPLDGREGLAYYLEGEVQQESQERIDDVEEYIDQPKREISPGEVIEIEEEVEQGIEYTSVVIDARGFDVVTALYPQVFDSQGYSLYGPTEVSSDNPANASSLVAYSRSEEGIMGIDRVGDNPLVIEAASVINRSGEAPTDLILDSDNARLFRDLDKEHGIVERRAVVFIID